jgi:hypothetical protein
MTFPSARVTFGGFGSSGTLPLRGCVFPLSRGTLPSAMTLYTLPVPDLNIGDGTLTLSYGGFPCTFTGCAVASAHIRRHSDGKWPTWAITALDRRYRWAGRVISGDFNRRAADGTVDMSTARTPADLAGLCLNALGEGGFDVSRMPTGVWPRFKFQHAEARHVLAWLCNYVACEVCLNPLTDAVEIWPLGSGAGTSAGLGLTPKYRFCPRAYVPASITATSGDVLFQSKLRLKNVTINPNTGQQALLANSSYKPSGGWANESPFSFPGISDATNRRNAFQEVYRLYALEGQQDGSLPIPGFSFPVTSTDQYLLHDHRLQAETDLHGFKRRLPAYVEGDYWAYTDLPVNGSNLRYTGKFTLDTERRTVEFARPVFKLSSSGAYEEPTLYLVTSYRARTQAGVVAGLFASGSVGGTGGILLLKRPEVFAVFDQIAGSNTQAQAMAELQAYVRCFQQKFANPWASEMTYPGLLPRTLDGNLAQVTWRWFVNREATTTVCEHEELDVGAVDAHERRRRQQLAQLAEEAAAR